MHDETPAPETPSMITRLTGRPRVQAGLVAYREFRFEGGPLLSAALAFYGIFALAPLLVLALALARLILGQTRAAGQIADSLTHYVGRSCRG